MHLFIKPLADYIKILYCNHEHFHNGDSGLDLFCPETIIVKPGETKCIDLMIQCEGISEELQQNVSFYLYPRSSIFKTGVRMANSVGIIDAGYRGNIKVALDNHTSEDYSIKSGDRLFQICGPQLECITALIVNELSETDRGSGGFGSTNNST